MKRLTVGILVLVLAAIFSARSIRSQVPGKRLGWDLTYSTVLETNKVGPDEWVRKWLKEEHRSPASSWISEWQNKQIISSILIEYPAFHAGERSTILLVRTATEAYYWESVIVYKSDHVRKLKVPLETYDIFFRRVTSWKQAKPLEAKDAPKDAMPGFIGFFSVDDRGSLRQMLLALSDFSLLDPPEGQTDQRGRLLCALSPILNDDELNELPPCKPKDY